MSLTMALILSAYVILCGALAYIGDLLGRRMGKKRITLLGLRPKYTAVVITAIIGGMIAVTTIFILIMINSSFRQLTLKGYDTVIELKQNEAKLTQTNTQLAEASKRMKAMEEDIRKLNTDLDTAKATLDKTKGDLQKADSALVPLRKQAEQLKQRNTYLDKTLAEKTKAVSDQEGVIKEQQQRAVQLRSENDNLLAKNKAYQKENDDLAQHNIDLNQENISLGEKNVELVKQNTELETSNETLVKVNQDLAKQRDELTTDIRIGKSTFSEVREKRIAARSKQELSRRYVRGGMDFESAKNEVLSLIYDASDDAETLGAVTNGHRAAFIPEKRLPNGEIADETRSIEAIALELSQSEGDVVLIAYSLINTVQGEPVPIEIKPYHGKTIYKNGDEIAKFNVKSDLNLKDAFSQVVGFLRGDVRNTALDSGLIPIQTAEGEYAPVGEMEGPDLLLLVEQLKGLKYPVVVSAHVSNDVSSAGPLKLSFRINKMDE